MTPQEIFDLFGQPVVLLRIAPRTKRPIDPAWEKTILADMTKGYLDSLNGNIGILHGLASGGLIGIEFDSLEAAKAWYRANPWAKDCLWSKGKRGPCFWVFILGDYPPSHNLYDADGSQVGEWRADGRQTVFCGIHPDGVEYTNNGKFPYHIAYDGIVWPAEAQVAKPQTTCSARAEHVPPPPFDDRHVVAKVGPPFWTDQNGAITKMNWQYFIERFCAENRVLFEQDEGWFFSYHENNGLWMREHSDAIKEMIRRDYQGLTIEWSQPRMQGKISNTTYNNMTNGAQALSGRTKVFQPLKHVIHCANGMLHLYENGYWKLMPFEPEFYSRNATPINWNPDGKCPKFQAILDTMEPDDADLLLRYAANVLLGGNPAQQILILVGQGGTSKSTVCELIELVTGRQNVAELRTKWLDERFEIGRYVGKTLLSGKDVKGNFLQSEGASRIKALTGHDMLTGEIKNQMANPEVYGNFAVVITCNERLTVRLEGDTDMSAWARRLLMIEFTLKSKHKEIIPNYAQKLIDEEGEGILALIVAAAFKHLAELDKIGTFHQTKAQRDRVDGLLAESRSVELFVKERVFRSPGSDVSTDELTTAYNEFCEERGWDPVALGILQRELPGHMSRYVQSNVGSHCVRTSKGGKERRVRGYPNVSLAKAEDDHSFEDEFPGFTGEDIK